MMPDAFAETENANVAARLDLNASATAHMFAPCALPRRRSDAGAAVIGARRDGGLVGDAVDRGALVGSRRRCVGAGVFADVRSAVGHD
jgi:hypothetical protein